MHELESEAIKEYSRSSTELKAMKPHKALLMFYRRLDDLISKTIQESSEKPACKSGCSYCCYYKVEAKPVEIFQIVEFVKANFAADEISEIIFQAQNNVAEAKSLTYEQHLATNQKCPFLLNNCCSIYEVRPSKCRNFHATESELCRESYEKPNDLSIPNSFVQLLAERANEATIGFEKAINNMGFDSHTYDLNSAFLEAFHNAKLQKRFIKRKRAFIEATLVETEEQ